MKIKIYVDYENQSVLTEEQYKEVLTERAKSYKADDGAFRDWLNDNYEAFKIFNMKSHELEKVMERWEGVCEADAEDDMNIELTEYELDV
jgi:hypothetical protein